MLSKRAFTLVELAIVIVIIGLLVASVLIGKELINQAKIQSILKNVESFKSATNIYKSKYNDVPGDSVKHSIYFPGQSFVEGNGNGIIDVNAEAFEYWHALSSAKLIKGQYPAYTSNTITSSNMPTDSGISYIFRCTPGNILTGSPYMKDSCWFWATKIGSGLAIVNIGFSSISLEDGKSLDLKIDDGIASSGSMLATGPSNSNNICTNTYPYNNGVTTGDYLTTDTQREICVPMFEFKP